MTHTFKKRLARICTLLLALVMTLGLIPAAQAAGDGFAAVDLTLQPGTDTTEVNLNWYAPTGTVDAKVRFTAQGGVSSAVTDAVESTASVAAYSGETVVCRATLQSLSPNTAYTYAVSNDGGATWSKDYTYTTPGTGEFSFAFVGDPQLKDNNQDANSAGVLSDGSTLAKNTAISQGWADTLSALAGYGVDFIASAGDQVDTTGGKEWEYTALYAPEEMQSLPFAAAVGNHDRNVNFIDHYNLPNVQDVSSTVNSTASAAATEATTAYGNYYYSYNNALFVVLNDSSYPYTVADAAPYIEAFRQTLEAATTAYPDYTWLFVQHHKSTESVAQHVADTDIQAYVEAGFEDLMDEYHVDFVLAGHDHVYARSYAMYNGERVSDDTDALTNPAGTIYLTCNTGSGLKYYGIFSSNLYVKTNTAYPYLANGLTGSAEYLKGVYPLSTEVAVQNYIPGYTIVNVDGYGVTFTTYATYAASDGTTAAGSILDTFTVTKTTVQETKTQGENNGSSTLNTELAARYDSEVINKDGGSTEIVVYNSDNECAYAVNGTTGHLVKIDMSGLSSSASVTGMTGIHIPVKEIMQTQCPDFAYGDMTSVAVSTTADVLAIAIQAEAYDATGKIAFFTYDGEYIASFDTGVQPDMVTFTGDGLTALTADEGEPREGTSGTDPKGSVTVVELNAASLSTSNVTTVDFTALDSQRQALVDSGVVLLKNTAPSTDLEPEYIAVSGNTAFVSLQEANAIAVLDLSSKTFTGVYPLGLQDFGTTGIDLLKDGSVNITNQANVYGIKMPDGISAYTSGGKIYLLTANEGDSRADWTGLNNEVEGKSSPTGGVKTSEKVVWFDATQYDGLDQDKAYIFGGRSFSIYEVGSSGLALVYDSGSDFETITSTAESTAANFNCSNDKITLDNRSGKKGPEPESVTVGTVGGRTYAYIALERIGGIMMYDITNPSSASYANYINSRDFSAAVAGDVSPEGLSFVSASESPTGSAMLLTANEVSGTVCAYTLSPVSTTPAATYTLTFETGGGSAVAAMTRTSGSTVDLTAYIPTRAGYIFAGWYSDAALKSAVTSVTLTKNTTVYVKWTTSSFSDVKSTDWFSDDVQYALENGLMLGTGDNTFSPELTASRGMIVTVLYRLEGSPAVSGVSSFSDVKSGSYCENAVIWAAANGIVNGYTGGAFGPDDSITREQLAAVLYRYAAYKKYDTTQGGMAVREYNDYDEISSYALESMTWAVNAGLINGSANNLTPKGDTTRAEVSAILHRFCEKIVK